MPRHQRAKIALGLALFLLCLSGAVAAFVIDRLWASEEMVHHTYDVEVATGDLESSLASVGRSRVAYVDSSSPESLQEFESAILEVGRALARIRQLTVDNPSQQALCDRLQTVANQRIGISRESVDLVQKKQSDPEKQLQINFRVARTAYDTSAITQQLRTNEDSLLDQRSRLSKLLFDTTVGILAASFLLCGLMFQLHYHLLNRELIERTGAETQLRQLSLELIRAQDDERRRFARELHDGLGQTLVGAKMLADTALIGSTGDSAVAELASVLNDAISQTRAISYLFHPPLLDEAGFASAARWLVDGYAQRMGLEVSTDFSSSPGRLPRNVEITLYRVLQEALNNIYRHSHSGRAEVSLVTDGKWAVLRVKDFGRGIPRGTLAAFRTNGPQVGVGLTGMRERVREQGGQLEIQSNQAGTEVIAKVPAAAVIESSDFTSNEPILKAE